MKPPYMEPYVRWYERTEVSHLLLLDFIGQGDRSTVPFLNSLFHLADACQNIARTFDAIVEVFDHKILIR